MMNKSNATWAVKMSTRRLEALLQVAGRGIDEHDMEDDESCVNLDAALEAYGVLLNELRARDDRGVSIIDRSLLAR